MSWRNELRPASFRGVPFEMVELGGSSGRRMVADESPETDELSPTADLGRVRPSFQIRGFVTGDDYLDKRDRILAALNARGPAELVHPWRGRLFVQVGEPVTHRHDGAGGACVIEFPCVLHGGRPTPFVETVATGQASAAVEAVNTAATAYYGNRATNTGTAVATEARLLGSLVSFRNGLVSVDDLGLINTPWSATYTATLVEAYKLSTDLRGLLAFVEAAAALFWPTNSASPLGVGLRQAYQDITDGMRMLALVRAVELSLDVTYTSADAAEQAAAATTALIIPRQDAIDDQTLFVAVGELQAAFVDTLTSVAARLPRERTITVAVPTPSIVVAFDTYGARRLSVREAELVKLNNIGHPGFVVGPTKVLAR